MTDTSASITRPGIDRARLPALLQRERAEFAARRPHSQALSQRAAGHLLFGVPLHWMADWPTPFSLFIEQARGAQLRDVDGHDYADFCLGDTGAMYGHAPAAVARAIAQQQARGYTTMLPSEDAPWVAEELTRRVGLPFWQFAATASDANRFAIRWARAATGRPKLLVFNGCYHGTVDDTFVDLHAGRATARASLLGQVHEQTAHTRVVEFNDLDALEDALRPGDVACLLAEPAMTNIGMVLPDAGYWSEAQALLRRHGTLLALDETHTLSSGPGGCTRADGLTPDLWIAGKALGGGLPCAAYGFSAELAQRAQRAKREAVPGHSGIGTTLGASALAMAALRAMLSEVMTDEAHARMDARATRLAHGLRASITGRGLPWCVTQLGARTEFQFAAQAPKNGTQASAAFDPALESLLHLSLLNRGLLITPFHNMLLTCPETPEADVDRLVCAFDAIVDTLQAH